MVEVLERIFFRLRALVLIVLALLTGAMGYAALDLHMDAGFFKALPSDHEFIETFVQYREKLAGTNRVIVIYENTQGDIYNKEYLTALKNLTDDVGWLSMGGSSGVTGLWTPNTRLYEITEEGFAGRDLIPSNVTPEALDEETIAQLRLDIAKSGIVGYLVSNDHKASMVFGELLDVDPKTRAKLDYFELGRRLEAEVRSKYDTGAYRVHIIGFAQAIADIAQGGSESVPIFFAVAFALTFLAVLLYVQSLYLALITVSCSLASVVWQYGLMTLLGFGLDPFAILVPFLIFAIGASHGIQQINLFSREKLHGASSEKAARAAFTGLFVPGLGALITNAIGFITLFLIPIPMIQEVAVVAAVGVALKIVSNLIMLPLLASYFREGAHYRARVEAARRLPHRIMHVVAEVAHPSIARVIFVLSLVLLGVAFWQAQKLHIGDIHSGAAELWPNARYNVDTRYLSENFDLGADVFTVILETPAQSCISPDYLMLQARFGAYLSGVEGVRSVSSLASIASWLNAGFHEGNLKFNNIPRNAAALSETISPLTPANGFFDADCLVLPMYLFLDDQKAETVARVVAAIESWRASHGIPLALGQDGRPRLGLGTSPEDRCWAARDGRDKSWTLLPGDLAALTYTPQPLIDAPQRFIVSGFARAPAEAGIEHVPAQLFGISHPHCPVQAASDPAPRGAAAEKPLWTFNLDVPAGETGVPQKLDIAAAMKAAGIEMAGASEIVISEVPESLHVRLASGNAGVIAAVNEVVQKSELPSMLIVYLAVIVIVFLTYFDWRASLICLVPLTLSTYLGYWFMTAMGIGLKIATLPVLVIAVGIGVDYAFYIYNRIEHHFAHHRSVTHAYQRAVLETGMAVVFTAIVLAIGVSTWAFSPLKFQADMGILMAFMFITNMAMAVIVMPAWALVLDRLVPRRHVHRDPSHGH